MNISLDGAFDLVTADLKLKPSVVTVAVRDNSHAPVFEDGDLVGMSADQRPPLELIGRICFVRLHDGRLLIKTLKRGSGPGLFTLTSSNAKDIEDVTVDWARPFKFRIPRDEWKKA